PTAIYTYLHLSTPIYTLSPWSCLPHQVFLKQSTLPPGSFIVNLGESAFFAWPFGMQEPGLKIGPYQPTVVKFRTTNFMIMADVLKILLIVVGILMIYVSYWLLAEALFPEMVEGASRQYRNPIKITLVGLAAAVAPVIIGGILLKSPNPLLKLSGITLLVLPAMLGLAGSAGLVLRIGTGLRSPVDESQPWRRVLRGGIVLALTFLLPVVGWIIIPVWVLLSGFGALLLSLQERRRERPSTTLPPLVAASEVRI
ncbi:MAG: hypothetical protein ACREIC_34315, partial [Limisphaerales bacterium]